MNADLIAQAVQEIAKTAPLGWRKIVFYWEFLEDEKIGLRNKFTSRCFGGNNFDIQLDDFDLGGTVETFKLMKAIYVEATTDEKKWKGILLSILNDGQFKCKFNYETAPLLNNNRSEVNEIICEGMSYFPSTN